MSPRPTGGAARAPGRHLGHRAVRRRAGASGAPTSTSPSRRAWPPSPTPASPATTSTGLPPTRAWGRARPGSPARRTPEVQDALRLSLNWHDGGGEGPGQMRAVIAACLAVAAGLARHVLVYRTVTESTAQGTAAARAIGGGGRRGRAVPRFGGFLQWTLPFGAVSAANWLALVGQRRMHEFGLTREQLGQIALNGRRNAALNPKAIYRDPMTMDDYLAARMISTPLCLFDCDAPCDGSTAFVVSHRDCARRPRPSGRARERGGHRPAGPAQLGPVRRHDHHGGPRRRRLHVGAHRAHARPTSTWPSSTTASRILAMVWLEALGFCGRGESGPFVEGGAAIARDGRAAAQHGRRPAVGRAAPRLRPHPRGLRAAAGRGRRAPGGAAGRAGPPEVAAVANGGGPIAGTMLLTRGRAAERSDRPGAGRGQVQVGGPGGQGGQGEGRPVAARGDEDRGVGHDHVVERVHPPPGVDHRGGRVVAHADRAHDVAALGDGRRRRRRGTDARARRCGCTHSAPISSRTACRILPWCSEAASSWRPGW